MNTKEKIRKQKRSRSLKIRNPAICTESPFKQIFRFRRKKIRPYLEKSILGPFLCKKIFTCFRCSPAVPESLQTSDVKPSLTGMVDHGMDAVHPNSLVYHVSREFRELLVGHRGERGMGLHETAVGGLRVLPPTFVFFRFPGDDRFRGPDP